MTFRLEGKRALVTGASSGIGKELARQLAAAGCSLVIAARRKDRLESLAQELQSQGTRAAVVQVDLYKLEQVELLIEQARQELGGIDILVNNAGSGFQALFWQLDAEKGERLFALNFLAPLRLMRAFLPEMDERNDGCIVNISSVSGLLPVPLGAHSFCFKSSAGFDL